MPEKNIGRPNRGRPRCLRKSPRIDPRQHLPDGAFSPFRAGSLNYKQSRRHSPPQFQLRNAAKRISVATSGDWLFDKYQPIAKPPITPTVSNVAVPHEDETRSRRRSACGNRFSAPHNSHQAIFCASPQSPTHLFSRKVEHRRRQLAPQSAERPKRPKAAPSAAPLGKGA